MFAVYIQYIWQGHQIYNIYSFGQPYVYTVLPKRMAQCQCGAALVFMYGSGQNHSGTI